MPHLPPLTTEFALRIEELVSPTPPDAPGLDPTAPEILRFGRTIASKGRGGEPADKVFCFGHQDLSRLEEILDFYRSDGIFPTFYLAPMGFTKEVCEALAEKGFVQREFKQAILYGLPVADSPVLPSGITIERVTAATLEEFVRTTAEGFQWPDAWREAAKEELHRSFRPTDYHFLARVNGEPSGVASMAILDGVASLEDGAVVPQQRLKGCHLALVRHRLRLAHDLGCSLVLGAAFFGSGSFRNQ